MGGFVLKPWSQRDRSTNQILQQELQPNGSGCAPFAAFFLDPFAALHLHPHAGAGLICTYSLGIPYTAEKGHGEKMLTS
jgi:hypothetical protein